MMMKQTPRKFHGAATARTLRIARRLRNAATALLLGCGGWSQLLPAAPPNPPTPSRIEVLNALKKAGTFFHEKCSRHGGYVWRISRDLQLWEGEGPAEETLVWVQPPGTPAVGGAFLDAFESTADPFYLEAATKAALALVQGQLQSGGWNYSIELDVEKRQQIPYRDNPPHEPPSKGRDTLNLTTLDDDVTPSVLRFLLRLHKAFPEKDWRIADAVQFGLEALLVAQAANGGWRHNWDRYPTPRLAEEFPSIKGSYPETWPRIWPNDWRGVYYLNDNITGNALDTLLLAWECTGDKRFFDAATRTGDFLVAAQMPEPQPAWAQQYDAAMHPVWDRRFEPPAITGSESQGALRSLLLLFRKSGEKRFLDPVPRALDYLKKSLLPDGRLARFYELQTNRPLYFKVVDGRYELVYQPDNLPAHYAFVVESRLARIEFDYQRLLREGPGASPKPPGTPRPARVREIIDAMDERGAWIDQRSMRGYNKASPEGVIQSATFIENFELLCRYLKRD